MSNKDNSRIRIGITLGDVNGIGPELIIQAFQDQYLREIGMPVLYGSGRALQYYRKALDVQKFHYGLIQTPSQAQHRRLNLIECHNDLEKIEPGQSTEIGGNSAYLALRRALEDAQNKELDVLVTLPVDKAAVQKVYPEFVGHTEMLTEVLQSSGSLMMMVSDSLNVALVTNHLPVSQVSQHLSVELIVKKVKLLSDTLRTDFSIQRPVIAVLGLNPHAGDQGLLGNEEADIIAPAVEELRNSGLLVTGPYPADGFFGSMQYQKFDAVVAMYHDQGLIPFKLLAGFSGVNYTAGLPIVRTSPDHGVAYDIAGRGVADLTSFREALYTAIDCYERRAENLELQSKTLAFSSGREREE